MSWSRDCTDQLERMRRTLLFTTIVLFSSPGRASAEQVAVASWLAGTSPSRSSPPRPVAVAPRRETAKPEREGERASAAVGINFPGFWKHSFAASVYLGLTRHSALRANIASYDDIHWVGDSEAGQPNGRATDIGLGWVWYPRRRWSGVNLELGPMIRFREQSNFSDTTSTLYAGRALLGWSWMSSQHVFLATGVGVSIGYQSGTQREDDRARYHSEVRADLEAYLRFGIVFGS